MTFEVAPELELFAESVRAALGGFEPSLEPVFGEWSDDRDDELAARLAALGWGELWTDPALLGPAVAGARELGRVVAPLHLVDEATLGAPLAADGRVRYGRTRAALPLPGAGLSLAEINDPVPEPTLDSTGTVRAAVPAGVPLQDAGARWRASSAATLGYLAGLAGAALDTTVRHVRSREQFGAPLAALPTVQQRLADASVTVDGLELIAWAAAAPDENDPPLPAAALAWAGAACREVTVTAHQLHGAVGFALESDVHLAYRRAKTVQVWAAALIRASS
jgi:hypothetical protein